MNTQQELTDKQVTPQPQQWQNWCMDSLQGLMSWVPNRNRQNMKKTWRGNIQVFCLHIFTLLKQHMSYCSFNLFNNKLFELHWVPNPDAVTIITTTTTTITTTTTTITKTTTSSSTTTTTTTSTTKTTITTTTITTTMSLMTTTTITTTPSSTTTITTTTTYIRDTF